MAEVSTIARPYAEAVFELAAERGELQSWSERLAAMASVARNAEVAAFVANPKITNEELVDTFTALVPAIAGNEEARNFVATLVENERLALLPAIAEQFEQLRANREGYAEAQIETAFPLPDGELQRLVQTLERRFKRRIKPEVSVDRELIGGVLVRVGDEVIDASVRGRLAQMQAALVA